ncbi:MAG: NAD(P)/FAD-dependent oxidoreductase [Candidatus Competibacteraceae bacterium]|nr:NAD(P)/FAD-dependent oxidoreductase [Candidatus Competibacteraceae bacterium]
MSTIIVLGAGIGGVSMAYEMRELAREDDQVIVVSDSETFHFVPSNPWVAVGWRKPEQIKIPLAETLEPKGIQVITCGAKRVHPDVSMLELTDGRSISYDHLVIATGPRLAFDEVPGLGPVQDGYTQSVCHVDHAAKAEQAWQRFVQQPGPVVVGAVQGASCFGPAYEYAFIMDNDLRKRKIRDRVPMTFVTAEPYIGHMGLGGVGDSKGMMEKSLRERDIKWICNAKVERIESDRMYVVECDAEGQEKKRHELPFHYSMLLPAFTGVDAVRGIDKLTNPRGFILVDQHQRNPSYNNVWGIGVCIAIAPPEATPVPTGIPKTGYMIESMVRAVAHNIRAVLDGNNTLTEATWNAICLADMGNTGVAFVAMPQLPPRNVAWVAEGKWVHVAKIAFEKYFMRKVRKGITEPVYEKYLLKALGINKIKNSSGV